MPAFIRRFSAALVVLLTFISPLRADELSEQGAGEQVALLAGSEMSAEPALFGVQMKMQAGWHTYWRNPGDSGLAPSFDWSASKNVASLELLWPAPQRFEAEGDTTYGYTGEIIWPVLVRAADPSQPLLLDLKMSYGICKDICVPGTAHLRTTVTAAKTDAGGFATRQDNGRMIRKALAHVPVAATSSDGITAKLEGKTLFVTLANTTDRPDLFPEGPHGVWFGKPEADVTGSAVIYKVPLEFEKDAMRKGADVTLTFSGPQTAIEAKVKVE